MSWHPRKTKIICTLGPASNNEQSIKRLAEAGMDIARLNFSHGDHNEHKKRFIIIRRVSKRIKKTIGIIQDLEGHRIRIGTFKNHQPIKLKRGQKIYITSKAEEGHQDLITVSYPKFESFLKKGYNIYIDDGKIALKVKRVKYDRALLEVRAAGILTEHKGVNVPQANFKFSPISKKDKKDLEFGLKLGVDYIAQSFVRYPEDIKIIKSIMKRKKRQIPVIAKIEDSEGIKNIDKIMKVADAIMIARGDMGVSLSLEKVPLIQKEIIYKCNRMGKPVITATQMLDSMTVNKLPTRAEVADVANAIIDGTDMVMLSAETAIGKFPQEAVSFMHRITINTEKSLDYKNLLRMRDIFPENEISEALGFSIRNLAQLIDIDAIIIYTKTGQTAKVIAKFRPYDSIIAVTDNKEVADELLLYWAVTPVFIGTPYKNPESTLKLLLQKKMISKGKFVIFTQGIRKEGKKLGSIDIFKV